MKLLLLFLNPPDYSQVSVNPYGLEIISSCVRDKFPDCHVQIVNPFYDDDPSRSTVDLVRSFQPDLIGASLRNADNALVVVDQGSRLKLGTNSYIGRARQVLQAVKLVSTAPIVVGGSAFTSAPGVYLEELGLDLGVIGPGEETLVELLKWFVVEGGNVGGLIKRRQEFPGMVIRRGKRIYACDKVSNRISHVARIERSHEQRFHRLFHEPYYVAVRYSSGCPERCAYCIEPINMNRVVVRDPDLIIREIQDINSRYEHYQIWLTASEINFPPKPLVTLCRKILRHKLNEKNSFGAFFFGKPMTKELYLLLKECNFTELPFTVSHFNEALLRRNGQMIRKKEFFKTLDIVKTNGEMPISLGLLFGQPGETMETLEEVFETVKMIDDIFTQGANVFFSAGVRVYPGTPLAAYCLKEGMDSTHIYGKDPRFIQPVHYSSPLPPLELCQYVLKRFSELNLKGNFSVMNAGLTAETTREDAMIDLDRALALLSRGDSKKGTPLYERSKLALSKSSYFRAAFSRFERVSKIITQNERRAKIAQ